MPLHRHSRPRPDPILVELEFLGLRSTNGRTVEDELMFLSEEVHNQLGDVAHVAILSRAPQHQNWIILKVGQWNDYVSCFNGKKVLISGLSEREWGGVGGNALVQKVFPTPLDTIVVKMAERHRDQNINLDDKEIFRHLQQEGVVFRPGKMVTTPNGSQFEVTLCEPVCQGILGPDTEIIVVTDSDQKETSVNGYQPTLSVESTAYSSDFDISQFLSLPPSEDDLDCIESDSDHATFVSSDVPISRRVLLVAQVLQRPIPKFLLDTPPSDSEDDEIRVYGHMRDIACLGVFSGDWVE